MSLMTSPWQPPYPSAERDALGVSSQGGHCWAILEAGSSPGVRAVKPRSDCCGTVSSALLGGGGQRGVHLAEGSWAWEGLQARLRVLIKLHRG